MICYKRGLREEKNLSRKLIEKCVGSSYSVWASSRRVAARGGDHCPAAARLADLDLRVAGHGAGGLLGRGEAGAEVGEAVSQTDAVRASPQTELHLGTPTPQVVDEGELQQGAEHEGWQGGREAGRKEGELWSGRMTLITKLTFYATFTVKER